MSARVDQFCDELRDRLNAMGNQVDALKSSLQRLPQQGEQALQSSLDDARKRIEAQKKKVEQAHASLKARAELKIAQVKDAVQEWKANREINKLNARADRAEQYAADAVYVAIAALNEAEEAIFDAVVARMDADSVGAHAAAVR